MSNTLITEDTSEGQHVSVHPTGTSRNLRRGSVYRDIIQLSGNVLYWILQLVTLWLTISVNILRNPMAWRLMEIICNVMIEMFVYIVLGTCSFLICIITHLDDYFSNERYQAKRF